MRSRYHIPGARALGTLVVSMAMLFAWPSVSAAQKHDFASLSERVNDFTLIMDIKIEMSFGMNTAEQESRLLATVVSEDGLVMFDGSMLEISSPFHSFSSFSVKTNPTKIELTTLDGSETFEGEYIGTDRYTRIGFARIVNAGRTFTPVTFVSDSELKVGDWIALYWLLPEFVSPSLAADIGMVSTIIELPERFPLVVGFAPSEILGVTFDENLNALGVLGMMPNPAANSADNAGLAQSMIDLDYPLLGIISSDRLNKLIADPPRKGRIARGWLGITLQALTPEIQEFFGIDTRGGIIVNEVMVGSPADRAGLEISDMIVSVNGSPVEVDTEERLAVFQRLISEMGPEAKVEFAVIRPIAEALDTLSVTAKLAQTPIAATEAEEYENDELEFKVRDLVFSDYMLHNLDAETFDGVVVSELEPGGLANIGGLRIGDVIQRIGSKEVGSASEAELVMDEVLTEDPSEVVFFVWRNNKTLFINIKTS